MSILENHKIYFIRRIPLLILIFYFFPLTLQAQGERKYIRQGNREYGKEKYSESEISYRKASDKNKAYPDAVFNTGDALYRQKKFEDAGKKFVENSSMNEKKDKKAAAFYNLGNSLLMSNKLKESIEAYENSLKLKPENQEAKYNLAYAQDLLKKQQQQNQQQNQSGNKDQNRKDQDKQQKNNQDQNKNQNNQNQQQDQNKQQQQPPEQTISKEDAERLLNAIANDEKNVQEKVKLAEAAKAKVRTIKNW